MEIAATAARMVVERQFIREVKFKRTRVAPKKSLRFAVGAWILIGLKCWAVVAVISHYQIPINPYWVTFPTLLFASLCTMLHFWGE